MAARTVRKMRAYSVHGFINPSDVNTRVINYTDFFNGLASSEYRKFRIKIRGETIAISSVEETQGYLSFLFVRGSDDSITVFDQRTGTSEVADLPDGHITVFPTWAIWPKGSRFIFTESRRPGVSTFQIQKYLFEYGKDVLGHPDFTFNVNPIAGPDFEREIERFTRIREVSVVLQRPNKEWDPAKLIVGDAAESDAEALEISARAGRKKSLAKNRGIVQRVREFSRDKISALKNVRITGNVPESEVEYTASLEKSQLVASARIDRNASESQNLASLLDSVDEIHEEELRQGAEIASEENPRSQKES